MLGFPPIAHTPKQAHSSSMNTPNRYPAHLRAALAPLPAPLPSMLRFQRLCRIELRKLTNEISQRYAAEQAAGQGFN
jgi:hypothetical protein